MPILASRGAASALGFGFGHQVSSGVVYATWNPADKGSTIVLSGGNLVATSPSSSQDIVRATIGKSSGKWYCEITLTVAGVGCEVGVANASASLNSFVGANANGWSYYSGNGNKYNGSGGIAYGASWTSGDIIGVALDMGAGTIIFYKNGVSQGTAFTGMSGTLYPAFSGVGAGAASTVTANFGATAFSYTVPSGYNAGLY